MSPFSFFPTSYHLSSSHFSLSIPLLSSSSLILLSDLSLIFLSHLSSLISPTSKTKNERVSNTCPTASFLYPLFMSTFIHNIIVYIPVNQQYRKRNRERGCKRGGRFTRVRQRRSGPTWPNFPNNTNTKQITFIV